MGAAKIFFQRRAENHHMDDLWLMVGSLCNLKCIHCYVDSSPENDSLEQLTLAEVKTYLAEGARFGLRSVYFTGGEPFINKEIISMLHEALKQGEVTVLTNATTPIVRYMDQISELHRENEGRLVLRVSMDHYREDRHDAIRGEGTFQKTVRNTIELSRRGIRLVLTVTPEVYRGNRLPPDAIAEEFKRLFANKGADVEVKILPAVLELGAQTRRRDQASTFNIVTEESMKALSAQPESLMCYNGRSVLKRNGQCRVYPCPIIYEVPEFDLGATLLESFTRPVFLSHRSCAQYCCLGPGKGSCVN